MVWKYGNPDKSSYILRVPGADYLHACTYNPHCHEEGEVKPSELTGWAMTETDVGASTIQGQ